MPEPIPVILLGQLAVDTDYQGRRLGSDLLVDAARRAHAASDLIGSRAIVVQTIDERAKSFFAHPSSQPCSNRDCSMPPHGPTATPTPAPGATNAASIAIERGGANVIVTRSRRAHPNETEPDATDGAVPAGGGEPPDRSLASRHGPQ